MLNIVSFEQGFIFSLKGNMWKIGILEHKI